MRIPVACVLALVLALLVPGAAATADTAPQELVRETTERVLAELDTQQGRLQSDPQFVFELVDEIVLPHFDFERMARLVLGRHWRDATEEQRGRFVAEFRRLLVRTYATALRDYSGQEVRFRPFRPDASDPDEATVRTEVSPPGGAPGIPINYRLRRGEDGAWKVYDISIEGISLVTNYRGSYARTVQTEGLEVLIEQLEGLNSRESQ